MNLDEEQKLARAREAALTTLEAARQALESAAFEHAETRRAECAALNRQNEARKRYEAARLEVERLYPEPSPSGDLYVKATDRR